MFFLLRNSTTENFNEISSYKCSDIRFCRKNSKCKTCQEMMMAGKCDKTGNKCRKTCGTCKGKSLGGCDTFGPEHIWSPDIWSPTIGPHLIGPSGQTVPNQFSPHGQMVPKNLVPMDKWSPTNLISLDKWSPSKLVPMDKWSPKIWSP